MGRLGRRKIVVLVGGVALMVALVVAATMTGWLGSWSRAPLSEANTHPIATGGYARAIVTGKSRSGIGRRAPHPPHYLEFASSAGAVDVYVVPCTIGYRKAEWDYVNKVTDEFAAGRVPIDVAAQASGVSGRIELKGLWKREGRPTYMVLVRSVNETEVKIVVHYGP